MPTGHAHTRRFMPSQAEAMPMRPRRSPSQWSVYWPIGIPASMSCWKTFGASAAAVRVVLMGVRLLGELVTETNSGDVDGPHASLRGRTRGPGAVTDAVRAASHPDSHRRSWSSTRSTGRWVRSGRGLSPPVRNFTDPGARVRVAVQYARARRSGEGQGVAHLAQRGVAEQGLPDSDGRHELVAVVDGADDGRSLLVLPDVHGRERD